MNALAKYDAAINAIAEAKAVDELLTIRDTADALRAAARVANNKQAEIDMAEIRFRAERRVGEMMAAQKSTVGLAQGRRSDLGPKPTQVATLTEAGIDKHLADRARKLAAIPKTEFDGIVGDWRERVEGENERVTVNLLKAGEKRLSRDDKEAALAEKIRAGIDALKQGRFGVILADPPWRFEPYSRDTGMDRAADNHYPTMTIDEIVALEPPAADDCVLFLWATAPMMPDALNVMLEWGFTYKSQIIWVKDRIGTGYWARNKHELLLIGTKGEIPAPAPGTQPESAIVAPVSRHSEKPEVFHQIIEGLFPNLPKIEMFSRAARNGWHAWGAESVEFDESTGEIIENTEPAPPAELDVAADAESQPLGTAEGDAGQAALSATQSTAAGMDRRDNSTESGPAPAALDPEAATTPPAAGRSPVDTHPEPGDGQHGEKPGSAGAPATDDASSDASSVVPFPKPHDGPVSSSGLPRHKLCLKVDSCAGTWREACWTCRKAAEQQIAVEAGGVQVPHHGDVA